MLSGRIIYRNSKPRQAAACRGLHFSRMESYRKAASGALAPQGNRLLLFTSDWAVRWAETHNETLKLSEFGNI